MDRKGLAFLFLSICSHVKPGALESQNYSEKHLFEHIKYASLSFLIYFQGSNKSM
jgi:hypothetical protein